MFVDHQKRDRRILLEDAVEDIRRRFGKRAISYAILNVQRALLVAGPVFLHR